MSKRIDLGYEAGPSRRWIKVKNRVPPIAPVREAFAREREKAAQRTRTA